LSCLECAHAKLETMPTDACQYLYESKGCSVLVKPLRGDCCVFCSYGNRRARRSKKRAPAARRPRLAADRARGGASWSSGVE
jgi:hypothetical protein